MKPDWDKLANEYKNSESVLIADVDCTAAGEPLCIAVEASEDDAGEEWEEYDFDPETGEMERVVGNG